MSSIVYTDEENKRWWKNLAKQSKAELIGTMMEKMQRPYFATMLAGKLDRGEDFSHAELAAMRKWHR